MIKCLKSYFEVVLGRGMGQGNVFEKAAFEFSFRRTFGGRVNETKGTL